MRSKDASPLRRRWAWLAVVVVGIIGQILTIIYFHVWQDEVRDLDGCPAAGLLGPPADRGAGHRVAVHLRRDRPAGRQIGAVPGPSAESRRTAAGFGGGGGVPAASAHRRTAQRCRRARRNGRTSTTPSRRSTTKPTPTSPRRPRSSGPAAPQSLVSWESLGHQGRIFVPAGPAVDELVEVQRQPAIEPIRAYAGLNSADGIKATAGLAAEELRRTGGLDRDVVAVATTTGTGWINEAEASALEYMYNGNTAIVSHAVLVPAQLDLVPRRQGERPAGRSGAVRGRRRVGARAAGEPAARSWWCSARASARSAARPRSSR